MALSAPPHVAAVLGYNLASGADGASCSASSTYQSYVCGNAIDASTATSWGASAKGNGSWLRVNLAGGTAAVSHYRVIQGGSNGALIGPGAHMFGRLGSTIANRSDDVARVGARALGRTDDISRGLMRRDDAMPLFTQRTASPSFRHGAVQGRTIGDVAADLRSGTMSPSALPVHVIRRNGELLSLNTRSTLALRRAGIDPRDWNIQDVTGQAAPERLLAERLRRNQMAAGADVIRITGAGPTASWLR